MRVDGALQAWVLRLPGLPGGLEGVDLLVTAATSLCPLFNKIMGTTVHVQGIWGGPNATGKLAQC